MCTMVVQRGLPTVEHVSGMYGVTIGRVFVWDLDETLIVFNSLLTGAFMAQRKSVLPADSAK
jgi:hypothetical protein